MHSTDDRETPSVTSGVSRGLPARLEQAEAWLRTKAWQGSASADNENYACGVTIAEATFAAKALREAAETITRAETEADDLRRNDAALTGRIRLLTAKYMEQVARAEAAEARAAELGQERECPGSGVTLPDTCQHVEDEDGYCRKCETVKAWTGDGQSYRAATLRPPSGGQG